MTFPSRRFVLCSWRVSSSLAPDVRRLLGIVRWLQITHWITVISFLALLITGVEILISHPRFYWGEVGNSLTAPLFQIPFHLRERLSRPATDTCCPTRMAGVDISTLRQHGHWC
jgi:hypothetical protein